ncbi:MAG: hypothetical protein COW30_11980 [Rhodospirillales bacterium CG15_BIG_FIL_POST_REV_8_21_14_020_66_15]|nr:MAG: hypothetical protein COW30_11980 [Rhodospirillales bacterium CG15_BIG_FIL_POST_REV_8_21_14_020_66_15]
MTNSNFGSWKFGRRLVVLSVAAAAFFLLASDAGAAGAADRTVRFAESSVVVRSADGEHRFKVEMAVTDGQRSRGLMFRQDIAADRGMLFDFGRETFISMWMRNTFIPLDMLFIGAGGRITYIREHTTPQSLEIIEAPERNRAVLEVAAGTVARLGIRVGDRVEHAIFR